VGRFISYAQIGKLKGEAAPAVCLSTSQLKGIYYSSSPPVTKAVCSEPLLGLVKLSTCLLRRVTRWWTKITSMWPSGTHGAALLAHHSVTVRPCFKDKTCTLSLSLRPGLMWGLLVPTGLMRMQVCTAWCTYEPCSGMQWGAEARFEVNQALCWIQVIAWSIRKEM